MLSAVNWTGSGDGSSWSDVHNWSTNALPDINSDVTLDASGATINGPTTATTINNLTVKSAKFVMATGDLTVTGLVTVSSGQSLQIDTGSLIATTISLDNSTLTLNGGTIKNATINESNGASMVFSKTGGTLVGITVNGNMDLTQYNYTNAFINGELVVNGTIRLGDAAGSKAGSLNFLENGSIAPSLTGNANVVFGGSAGNSIVNGSLMALTFGKDVQIGGKSGGIAAGANNYTRAGGLKNLGTINVDTAGSNINIGFGNDHAVFINQGTINVSNGTLGINELMTPDILGTVHRTGGVVNFGGTIDLGGGTFELNATTGSWNMTGGTFINGTINETGGAQLFIKNGMNNGAFNSRYSGNLLSHITVNGSLDLSHGTFGYLSFDGGLILNGTMYLGGDSYSEVSFGTYNEPAGSLTGNATIVFGNAGGEIFNASSFTDNSGILSFGSNVVIRGKNGKIYKNYTKNGFKNLGTISADTDGGTIDIGLTYDGFGGSTASNLDNQGNLYALNGGTLVIGTVSNGSQAILSESPTSTINAKGDLLATTSIPAQFKTPGTVIMSGSGTAASPQLLEVISNDLGSAADAFKNNSAFGSLALSANTYVKLVDRSHNSLGTGAEALYTNSLVVPAGTTLDLGGLHLYATTAQISGNVIGSITLNSSIALNAISFSDAQTLKADYAISGLLSAGAKIDLYWATGTTLADQIGTTPAKSLDTVLKEGSYVASCSYSSLGQPPANATAILAVLRSDSTDLMHQLAFVLLPKLNHAPTGTSNTLLSPEDVAYTFKLVDFGFSDPNDNPSNAIQGVKFSILPTAGRLSNDGVALSQNQIITAADIAKGLLRFSPHPGITGTYLLCNFQVIDDGGTLNGGINTDPFPKVLYIKLTPRSHFPVGTDKTTEGSVDAPYVISIDDFGFDDPNDKPQNTLIAVKFPVLPTAGQLKLGVLPVSVNQAVDVADIRSGRLVFIPNAGVNPGIALICKFQVQDSGGTSNSGEDTDPLPRVLNINLTADQAIHLRTGNIVISAPNAKVGGSGTGAVYLLNGTTGAVISTLYGSHANDMQGAQITTLPNGNFVVSTPYWDNGTNANAGAITFVNGVTGLSGAIGPSISLVGSSSNDLLSGVRVLSTGNYLVIDNLWSNGSIASAGSLTFGSGTTGVRGTISAANSVIGSTARDFDLFQGTELPNGNFVLSTPYWDNGRAANAGAITFIDGKTGTRGLIGPSISLVGSSSNDLLSGVRVLSTGNYLVIDNLWSNGSIARAGSITFGDGTKGVRGAINSANSLVGTKTDDLKDASSIELPQSIDNRRPKDIQISNASVLDGSPAGTFVGSFSTIDADLANSFTYVLVPGDGGQDNSSFTISANGSLSINTKPNFWSKSLYSIRVRTIDQGGLYLDKVFTLTVSLIEIPF